METGRIEFLRRDVFPGLVQTAAVAAAYRAARCTNATFMETSAHKPNVRSGKHHRDHKWDPPDRLVILWLLQHLRSSRTRPGNRNSHQSPVQIRPETVDDLGELARSKVCR